MAHDKDLKGKLEHELSRAFLRDLSPPGLEDPSWLPSAAEREKAERAEAAELLEEWRKRASPPDILQSKDAADTVLGTCGASRGYFERLLTDADYSGPCLLISDRVDGPYAKLSVPRHSRLARASGTSVEGTVDVEIPAASFATHIATRVNVAEPDASWLWRALAASLSRPTSFSSLFSSLSFSKSGGDLKVEFSSAN
jgi:hypothetical protein